MQVRRYLKNILVEYISGHGEHKTKAKLRPKPLNENEKEKVVAPEGVFGDVLVSVTGVCYI